MECVARHLVAEARSREGVEFDLFARTAFNRYYYACYRIVRRMLAEIYPNEAVPPHKSLPEKIENKLYKFLRDAATNAVRTGTITQSEAMKIKHTVREATNELGNVLRTGYAVRCIADYELDEVVTKDNGKIVLCSTSLASASNWFERVDRFCGTLISEWHSLGY